MTDVSTAPDHTDTAAAGQEAPTTQDVQMREALRQALTEEMERDPDVFLMGEEVAEYNGAYKVSKGMLDHFGP
ncbi:MAG: hypothetical protein ACOCXJ_08360, partial [Planctomycetota bacterium]